MAGRFSVSAKILALVCVKLAAGARLDKIEEVSKLSPSIRESAIFIARSVSELLVVVRGPSRYCRLCGRGPLTGRGFYMHVTRLHMDYVVEVVGEELERALREA